MEFQGGKISFPLAKFGLLHLILNQVVRGIIYHEKSNDKPQEATELGCQTIVNDI